MHPELSAIVIARDNQDTIAATLASIVDQDVKAPFEIIAVVSGRDRTAEVVRSGFPHVRLVALPRPALPGEARNAGVAASTGKFLSFPGSHVELPAGSLAARLRAHRQRHAMVTGSILNGTDTPAGWASYFMDHSDALPGRPSGELPGPPAHCSYEREALLLAGPFPENMRAGEDTVVNTRVWRSGHRAYRAREVTLCHRSRCTTPGRLVRHHFVRGRAWGRILADRGEGPAALSGYVRKRLGRTENNVLAWGGDLVQRYRPVRHLVVLGIRAAGMGALCEMLVQGSRRFGR